MKIILLLLAIAFTQDVPLKPKEEFEVKLDYQFKPRPQGDRNTVRLGESVKEYEHRTSNTVLPYLVLHIKMLELPEEKMRMRITTNINERVLYKKVERNGVVVLDLGFTDDMVDRVTAHQYTATFVNAAKEAVDKIVIRVDEEGSFFVNGEKRGKF